MFSPVFCVAVQLVAFVGSGHKRLPTDEKERRILELEKENKEPKRANEILKDALVFFAESRKK